jgi:predicted phosphodiesterase
MIGLISDIHGNFEALQAVLNELDKCGVSDIYCLGDVSGYYTEINECCEELRRRKIKCVLGNHDWYLISGVTSRSKSENTCIAYQKRIITDDNLNWVSSFPVYRKADSLALVHGGWSNPIDEYLRNPTEEYFKNLPELFFASGHTHKQLSVYLGNKHYCNPGSVGQPRDGDNRAGFALFDGEKFELGRIGYDINRTCELMKGAGFSEYYYKRLYTGAEHFIS